MVGFGPNWEESIGSQRQDHFLNLKRRRDREVSVHTTRTSKSHSRSGSHVSHEENTKTMQMEIHCLRRRLRREWRRWTPSNSNFSSNEYRDGSYRSRSRTSPSKSFLCNEDYHHECRSKSSSFKGLGNNAKSKALNQIFRSSFTHRIEGGKVPR